MVGTPDPQMRRGGTSESPPLRCEAGDTFVNEQAMAGDEWWDKVQRKRPGKGRREGRGDRVA